MTQTNSQGKEVRYLFRFRDLIAATISEHRKIIIDKGSCWWGWWKRPTEGSRDDVWGPLEKEATKEQPVRIGLFDSGNGIVYQAWVSQIIKPFSDSIDRPPIPKEEVILVPEYYRSSPFSRAWMRLVEIDPTPIEFLDKYSFAQIPPLPNYSEAVLNRLQGKVIKSADELRGMDTTIWRVRLRRLEDHDEEIILTTRSLSAPVSREVIDVRYNTILHITDPHFAIGDNRNEHVWSLESEKSEEKSGKSSLVEAIDLALNKKPIGLIIVTGDLTFTGKTEEFEAAATSLTRLLGMLNLDKDRLIVIPGNHDIQWTKTETYDEDAEVTVAPTLAKKNYEGFYRKIYGHKPNVTLSMGRRFMLPCGMALEVCALNSSSLETGPRFLAGMGRIEERAYTEIENELRWGMPSMSIRVLALHHHLVLTENIEPASEYYHGYGIAVDAPRIMRQAAKSGIHLVLHGHKHRAFIWRTGVYELPEHTHTGWQLGNISIVGGGSAGSKATEANNNYFNLLDLSHEGIELSMYRSTVGGTFGRMSVWRAGFELKGLPPRLKLLDWTNTPV